MGNLKPLTDALPNLGLINRKEKKKEEKKYLLGYF